MRTNNRSPAHHSREKSDDSKSYLISNHLRIFKSPTYLRSLAKNSITHKSALYTSPNSYQSSQIVSKKQSKEKTLKRIKKSEVMIRPTQKTKPTINKSSKQNLIPNKKLKSPTNPINPQKKPRWKTRILQQFPLTMLMPVRQPTTSPTSLDKQLQQLHSSSNPSSKRNPSHSFLGFLLSENQDQSKKTTLLGPTRIVVLDWMFLVGASLLINRETVHLAVHYLDSYFCGNDKDSKDSKDNKDSKDKEAAQAKIPALAVAALLIAIKQEERELQRMFMETVCMSEKFHVVKEQVIECEKQILTSLNFRLKSNTLAFWIDYFSLKWDNFVDSREGEKAFSQAQFSTKIKFRSTDGNCYRLYRQMMQLADVGLMFGDYISFQKSKLSLACLYLILRIQSQHLHTAPPYSCSPPTVPTALFQQYYKQFQKRASPIFKDPYRINQIFNNFLTQTCEFEITQIIACIKYVANFLELDFCCTLDQRALQETKSYEDFVRRMSYSGGIRVLCMRKIGGH